MRTCPKCGSEDVEVHYEQFGMASRQVDPARCLDCDWIEGQHDPIEDWPYRCDFKRHEKEYFRDNGTFEPIFT